jgi:segregation and condensation protein B
VNYKAVVEGILFVVGDEGVTLENISSVLNITEEEVKEILISLRKEYESDERGIRISFLGNTFKLTTKSEHKEYYERLISDTRTYTLSDAAIETLAVIVYNEPVTRLKVDEIRGVNSAQMIRKLLAIGLVKEVGRADTLGKPILYRTTNDFLDYFGLATKEDLPKLEENNYEETELKDLYKSNYKENE